VAPFDGACAVLVNAVPDVGEEEGDPDVLELPGAVVDAALLADAGVVGLAFTLAPADKAGAATGRFESELKPAVLPDAEEVLVAELPVVGGGKFCNAIAPRATC